MKSISFFANLLVVGALITLSGCDSYQAPTTVGSDVTLVGGEARDGSQLQKSHFSDTATFDGGVTVYFDTAQLDGTNKTLCWVVSVDEASSTEVTQFAFENVPSLSAVTQANPSQGFNQPENFGFPAYAFHPSASDPLPSRTMCATFATAPNSNVGVGYVGINTRGGDPQSQLMVGPFARVFGQDDGSGSLTGGGVFGSAFVDPNQDGTLDEQDPARLPNITVELFEETIGGEVKVAEAITDALGFFEFDKIFDEDFVGKYLVRVRADASAVNKDILDNFSRTNSDAVLNVDTNLPTAGTPGCPTGGTCPASWTGQAGAFFPSIDFGFYAESEVIEQRIENGEIITFGIPAKEWLRAYRTARRKADNEIVAGNLTRADFLNYLTLVEGLHFADPFLFGAGDDNRIRAAIEFLDPPSNTSESRFIKETLTAELNQVSGNGLDGKEDLLNAITKWAEGVIIKKQLAAKPGGDAELDSGGSMLNAINGGGGGGGGNF